MSRVCFFLGVLGGLCLFATRSEADFVAYWNFDSNFEATVGGSDFNLSPEGGATVVGDGRFGNAASFDRASSQFAFTQAGQVLQANSDFSYSVWFNYTGPEITGGDRYFVLETIGVFGANAWTASLGLRNFTTGGVSGSLTGNVAEHFTHPSQGWGRSAYDAGWNNAIVTYDADGGTLSGGLMTSYMNGLTVSVYDDVPSTTEVEGLVIGGHRAGTGRNFTGLIDEVAFFDDVLTSNQISNLQTMDAVSAMAIPEPSSTVILAGIACVVGVARRRRRN